MSQSQTHKTHTLWMFRKLRPINSLIALKTQTQRIKHIYIISVSFLDHLIPLWDEQILLFMKDNFSRYADLTFLKLFTICLNFRHSAHLISASFHVANLCFYSVLCFILFICTRSLTAKHDFFRQHGFDLPFLAECAFDRIKSPCLVSNSDSVACFICHIFHQSNITVSYNID